MAHLVTGYKGTAHITPADDGAFNAALIGTGDYVLPIGEQFEAQIITNNSVRIFDGNLVMQGRHVNIPAGTYEDVTIANGAQDTSRNDLIVMRYTKDGATGIETAELAVVQGAATSGTAEDPAVVTGDILAGAEEHEMPLYRVSIVGLTVESVTPLFAVISNITDHYSKDEVDKIRNALETLINANHVTLEALGITASATELNHMKGVTAGVQGQLDGKMADRSVQDSTSAGTLANSRSGFCTERDIYYGLPTINGSHSYTSSTNIYAPTSVGTKGYHLESNGSGAPVWVQGAGGWTATKITSEGGFGTKSFNVDTTKHDFIVIEMTIAGNMANRLIPCGIVGTFGTYTDGAGYSATNVSITCTTTKLTFTLGSTNQTESLKVYYLDRK